MTLERSCIVDSAVCLTDQPDPPAVATWLEQMSRHGIVHAVVAPAEGYAAAYNEEGNAILACRRQPNIYLCLCGVSCGHIEQIIRHCPPDRLLFGSDGGFSSQLIEMRITMLRESDASASVLRRIFHLNPQRLLPLQEHGTGRRPKIVPRAKSRSKL